MSDIVRGLRLGALALVSFSMLNVALAEDEKEYIWGVLTASEAMTNDRGTKVAPVQGEAEFISRKVVGSGDLPKTYRSDNNNSWEVENIWDYQGVKVALVKKYGTEGPKRLVALHHKISFPVVLAEGIQGAQVYKNVDGDELELFISLENELEAKYQGPSLDRLEVVSEQTRASNWTTGLIFMGGWVLMMGSPMLATHLAGTPSELPVWVPRVVFLAGLAIGAVSRKVGNRLLNETWDFPEDEDFQGRNVTQLFKLTTPNYQACDLIFLKDVQPRKGEVMR